MCFGLELEMRSRRKVVFKEVEIRNETSNAVEVNEKGVPCTE